MIWRRFLTNPIQTVDTHLVSTTSSRWRVLLEQPTTRVIAFHPNGADTVPLPEDLADLPAQRMDVAGPLDLLDQSSRHAAVVAYEKARRDGRGGALVHLTGEATATWLDVIDATATHGCFLGIMTDCETTDGADRHLAPLPIRRSSCRFGAAGGVREHRRQLHRPSRLVGGRGDGNVVPRPHPSR